MADLSEDDETMVEALLEHARDPVHQADQARRETQRMKDAILDIDRHAVALGQDEHGWAAIGYFVSIGVVFLSADMGGSDPP